MPSIRPFKGFRYVSKNPDISSLIAPPYDVLSHAQRDALLKRNPDNIVSLELPAGVPDAEDENSCYRNARRNITRMEADGVIAQDTQAALYLLEQRFAIRGTSYDRTMLICETALHDFDEGIILPHERTLPDALTDRYFLMEATNTNLSPIFGLYSADHGSYTALIDKVRESAPVAVGSEDGVDSALWMVTDEELITRFQDLLAGKQLFIGDGHHRYTVALRWRNAVRERRYGCPADEAPSCPGFDPSAPEESVMFALANMDDPGLRLLPYHRAARAEGAFDATAFTEGLKRDFVVRKGTLDDLKQAAHPAFLFDTGDGDFLAELKPDIDLNKAIEGTQSSVWKHLDVAVLQKLALAPLLDVHTDDPVSLERMTFSHDAAELKEMLTASSCDVVFTMRPVRLAQLQAVSLAGETMPQKSTYFSPKPPSGFVIRDMTAR